VTPLELALDPYLNSTGGLIPIFHLKRDGEFGVFSNGGPNRGVPLEFHGGKGLLLRCGRNVRIPLQKKQGNRPSSREEEWKTGLYLSCGMKLSVPLTWGWVSWGPS